MTKYTKDPVNHLKLANEAEELLAKLTNSKGFTVCEILESRKISPESEELYRRERRRLERKLALLMETLPEDVFFHATDIFYSINNDQRFKLSDLSYLENKIIAILKSDTEGVTCKQIQERLEENILSETRFDESEHYRLRIEYTNSNKEKERIIDNFQKEFDKKRELGVVLAVRDTSSNDKWTITAPNKKTPFKAIVIDDSNSVFSMTLNKKPITWDDKFLKLSSSLNKDNINLKDKKDILSLSSSLLGCTNKFIAIPHIRKFLNNLRTNYAGSINLKTKTKKYTIDDALYSEDKNRRYVYKKSISLKSTEDAIALLTLKAFSSNLLPKSATMISEMIDKVEERYKGHQYKPIRDWVKKVDIVPRYQPLFPPETRQKDTEIIYDALYRKKGLKAKYLASSETCEYWPVRLIQREQVLYVICATINTRHKAAQYAEYAVHRFNTVELLEASPGFQISYNKSEIYRNLSKRERKEGGNIDELVFEIFGMPAQHMSEVSFHKDSSLTTHKVIKEDNGKATRTKITARNIVYTYELFSWLLGFGAQINVHKPSWLRTKLRKELEDALSLYQQQGKRL